jgi:protein-S-isoprenylcysteine O-methyltransferase Ste14
MNDMTAKPSSIPWPPLLLATVVGSAFVLDNRLALPWPGLDDLPARLIGSGLGIAGLALMAWAVYTLWRHETTVMPHQASSKLVTAGPFRYRRNPIYIADVLLLLGLAELSKNLWLVIGAILFVPLVTWLAILPEERHLEAKFGDEYRRYKETTRRWI